MENTIKFKYNGKIWNPKNPEKKLKQLGITWDDVEIIENQIKEEKKIEYMNPKLYEFRNRKTGEIILSIYDNLDLQMKFLNTDDWEFIGLKKYE